jgi:hypothetical protein
MKGKPVDVTPVDGGVASVSQEGKQASGELSGSTASSDDTCRPRGVATSMKPSIAAEAALAYATAPLPLKPTTGAGILSSSTREGSCSSWSSGVVRGGFDRRSSARPFGDFIEYPRFCRPRSQCRSGKRVADQSSPSYRP